ncbi:hypothetical protein AAHE18_05G065800 [Arachis hypogaea]
MFPRIIFLSRGSFFVASQLLHISYQSSWTRELVPGGIKAKGKYESLQRTQRHLLREDLGPLSIKEL